MNIRNSRKVASGLPASWIRTEYLMKGGVRDPSAPLKFPYLVAGILPECSRSARSGRPSRIKSKEGKVLKINTKILNVLPAARSVGGTTEPAPGCVRRECRRKRAD
ncbi:hypothetical protein EVAR_49924_1 [Eumeta japonica]|uniref:Uncharacterized protein n=1 Tax=Eumeta variegata TaxID=151549 RepID=A0A4C1Y4B4_EUMVA|nr:hypothetical protein EVAR_49924_1 [Eumeta japonica]